MEILYVVLFKREHRDPLSTKYARSDDIAAGKKIRVTGEGERKERGGGQATICFIQSENERRGEGVKLQSASFNHSNIFVRGLSYSLLL